MHENKLAKKIKSGAVVKLLLSLPLLLGAVLLIYMLSNSDILSMDGYFKPIDVLNSLSAIDDIAQRPLGLETYNISLTVPFTDIVDADIQKTEDDKPVGEYLAVFLDNKYVFCYIREDKYNALTGEGSYTFTGSLRKVDPKVISLAVEDMAKENINESDARDMLYSYYIDTTNNGAIARTFLYILTLFLLISGLLLAARSMLVMIDVKNYSQVKKLSKCGDVDNLLEEIEQEYAAKEDSVYSLGKGRGSICLAEKWIILLGSLGVKFMRAEDLLWVYKLKHTTKQYGITTSVSYYLKLKSKDKELSVLGKEKSVDMLLYAITEEYPGVIVGYSASLEAAWKTNIDQFSAFAGESRTGM